jgi:hypothetical protein
LGRLSHAIGRSLGLQVLDLRLQQLNLALLVVNLALILHNFKFHSSQAKKKHQQEAYQIFKKL